jgi:hypothetical protein
LNLCCIFLMVDVTSNIGGRNYQLIRNGVVFVNSCVVLSHKRPFFRSNVWQLLIWSAVLYLWLCVSILCYSAFRYSNWDYLLNYVY